MIASFRPSSLTKESRRASRRRDSSPIPHAVRRTDTNYQCLYLHGGRAGTVTADSDIFYGFVFDDEDHPQERVEQAARAVQRQLGSGEVRRVNDALLARLAEAKENRRGKSKKELLYDPAISVLVNTLVLVNQGWITTVIANNLKGRPHLRGSSVREMFSAALTGEGAVGGVMNAILEYDYAATGVAAFSPYLARAISNALAPTPKQDKTFRRVESRTGTLRDPGEAGASRGWVDRMTPPPDAPAMNHELLEVVQSVIPHLSSPQHRLTAAWMIDRILTAGEVPMGREAAQIQQPPVSRERGRQIMEATVDSIRRQIEADYPQLAEQGVNGWEQFKKAFAGQSRADPRARTSDRCGDGSDSDQSEGSATRFRHGGNRQTATR